MGIEPLYNIFLYLFDKSIGWAFFLLEHLIQLLNGLLEAVMLCLMLIVARIIDLLLKLLLCAEMEISIICKIIQSLYSRNLSVLCLAAVQQFVNPVNQLLVL